MAETPPPPSAGAESYREEPPRGGEQRLEAPRGAPTGGADPEGEAGPPPASPGAQSEPDSPVAAPFFLLYPGDGGAGFAARPPPQQRAWRTPPSPGSPLPFLLLSYPGGGGGGKHREWRRAGGRGLGEAPRRARGCLPQGAPAAGPAGAASPAVLSGSRARRAADPGPGPQPSRGRRGGGGARPGGSRRRSRVGVAAAPPRGLGGTGEHFTGFRSPARGRLERGRERTGAGAGGERPGLKAAAPAAPRAPALCAPAARALRRAPSGPSGQPAGAGARRADGLPVAAGRRAPGAARERGAPAAGVPTRERRAQG